jgi:hypothetical protein
LALPTDAPGWFTGKVIADREADVSCIWFNPRFYLGITGLSGVLLVL